MSSAYSPFLAKQQPSVRLMVEAHGLSKVYGGRQVVDNIDLAVRAGECFGLLGPNGAGKTTTLRMLLGNAPMSAGDLTVMGYSIPRQARQMRARVGVVPQADNLDPDFTVTENLLTYASYFGLGAGQVRAKLAELLNFAALEGRGDAAIATLSGGMKRRLTLARALVNDPELLILDEPTTGLDPQARQLIWRRLRGLLHAGKTLILTTHYMEEAERLCDRLAIMDQGRILALDSPAALIAQHIEPQVIEVYGPGLAAWQAQLQSQPIARTELVGETLFCYVQEAQPLLASLSQASDLHFHHRRATLEDVFLKLTGKELRD